MGGLVLFLSFKITLYVYFYSSDPIQGDVIPPLYFFLSILVPKTHNLEPIAQMMEAIRSKGSGKY